MGWRRVRSWKNNGNGFRAFWFPTFLSSQDFGNLPVFGDIANGSQFAGLVITALCKLGFKRERPMVAFVYCGTRPNKLNAFCVRALSAAAQARPALAQKPQKRS